MKVLNMEGRAFMKMLESLPIAYYTSGYDVPQGNAAQLSPEDSLRKLVRLLGPWSEKVTADDFIECFLGAGHNIAHYLPDHGLSLQGRASHFSDDAMGLSAIDLHNIPEKEQELLVQLSKQLYSFIDIRFIVTCEQPWGECQADNLRYTRAPETCKSR